MARRKKNLIERFSQDYKKSKTEYINMMFSRLLNRRHNGKDFTVHMITNWIYSKNDNPVLDDVFENLMLEVDPIGLAKDKEKMAHKSVELLQEV